MVAFDLFIAASAILLLSGVAALLSFRWTQTHSQKASAIYLATCLLATTLFAFFMHGQWILALLLPLSSVIIWGNWIPIGLFAIAGALAGYRHIPLSRRLICVVPVILVAVFSLVQFALGDVPNTTPNWKDDVAIQSTQATCGPCAVATLLKHYDIDSDESELAKACFTQRRGTPKLGIYRGLALRTNRTQYQAIPFHCSIEELLDQQKFPAILFVHLEEQANADPRYAEEWGWTPGLRHVVVIYDRIGTDRVAIGDPSVGREEWTLTDLRQLWHGNGIRLAAR